MKKLFIVLATIAIETFVGCNLTMNQELSNTDQVSEEDFIYRLYTLTSEFNENEQVKIFVELEYIGNREQVSIYQATSSFSFPMIEKTRHFRVEYPMQQPLRSTTLVKRATHTGVFRWCWWF
ncbi:hypothetical protein ACFSCX_23340 [Bacillus salitolerans]|uniref:Lipoprotein n=1 Tax=Bacillus salitolerans TaxID=1437434 RepID=A0ABW4LX91_9BACI